MRGLEIAVVVLAVARVSRLLAEDTIAEGLRQQVARRAQRVHMLQMEPWCRWCVTVWFALPAAGLWWALSATPRLWDAWWFDVPAVGLAIAYVCGLLARLER